MENWKRKYRMINGKKRLCKVRSVAGKEQVRIVGHRNLTDKTARKVGRSRKSGYYSATDKRKSRPINKSIV